MTNQVDAAEAARVMQQAELLHPATEVEAALDAMAEHITADLGERDPLLLCVMSGAVAATGQLMTRLNFPLKLDYLHATRYNDTTQGSELDWVVRPRHSLQGRVVLVIDDILDAGITLHGIVEDCRRQGAAEVYCAVLVSKRRPRAADIHADFIGLEVEDRYLFGYGMDYHGYWRNARGIYAVKDL
jgi:hypoxanthine phosphoribosyltransferase